MAAHSPQETMGELGANLSAKFSATAPETLLYALQLADSLFPTGGFTLSHGLEAGVNIGLISSPEEVENLLRVLLGHSTGTLDAIALAGAWRAAESADLDIVQLIDEELYARKLSREGREASARMGRNLLTVAGILAKDCFVKSYRALVDAKRTPGTHAVALGVLTSALGIGEREAVLGSLYTFAAGYLGAAQRLLPLDHLTVQAILGRMRPVMVEVAEEAISRPWQEMSSFAPEAEILAMRHERTMTRMFAS